MKNLSDVITEQYLRKLDNFSVKLNRPLQSSDHIGARRATGKGASLEFADFRQYAPGDDMRRVDWNSYARFNKLYVKTYADERQATANIFVDVSRSMDYGRSNKMLFAKLLAASIAYIYLNSMDRVCIFEGDEQLRQIGSGISGKEHFGTAVRLLDSLEANGNTSLSASLKYSRSLKLSGGICYVISDFLPPNGFDEGLAELRRANQQIICIQVLAGDEVAPDLDGRLRLVDSETDTYKDISITEATLSRYSENLENLRSILQEYCSLRSFGYVFANTDKDILEIIRKIL